MYLLILLMLFTTTVAVLYLPYLHWYRWQGHWRLFGLLTPLPQVIYVSYAVAGMFAEPPERRLEPGIALLVIFACLAVEGVLRWLHRQRSDQGSSSPGQGE